MQVFLVRSQVGLARGKFSETDDAAFFLAQVTCFQNAQALSDDSRGAPAQFADQQSKSLTRAIIKSCLDCSAHNSLYYKIEVV